MAAALLRDRRDRSRARRAGRAPQIVRIRIELTGDPAQLAGDLGIAFRDTPQFDRRHSHEGDRVGYRSSQTVAVGRHANVSPRSSGPELLGAPILSIYY